MSWNQLHSILAEQRAQAAYELQRGPIDCPNDGEPLQTGPDGHLFCPFDGWRP